MGSHCSLSYNGETCSSLKHWLHTYRQGCLKFFYKRCSSQSSVFLLPTSFCLLPFQVRCQNPFFLFRAVLWSGRQISKTEYTLRHVGNYLDTFSHNNGPYERSHILNITVSFPITILLWQTCSVLFHKKYPSHIFVTKLFIHIIMDASMAGHKWHVCRLHLFLWFLGWRRQVPCIFKPAKIFQAPNSFEIRRGQGHNI